MDPQVVHDIPGAEEGLDDAVDSGTTRSYSSAVSQVQTQHMQQTGSNPPPATAASHVTQNTAAGEQVQLTTKFDVPAFEGDNTASWLAWSRRVVYQARACGFEAALAAAEGEGLSGGADAFDASNTDPVILRNARSLDGTHQQLQRNAT